MRTIKLAILALGIFATTAVSAQLKTPQPSPVCTIQQTVGLTDVEVEYSRPGMKDRKIFGEMLAYGDMWRLGANASTKINFSSDVTIAGMTVPAGQYAMYAIPAAGEWEMILYKDLTLWGTGGYDKANDLGRFKVKTQRTGDTYETLTIDFERFTTDRADLVIRWENTMVSFPIITDAVEQVDAQIKEILVDGPGAGTYANAASFYLDQGKDLEQALSWLDKAVEMRPEAFWYLHRKALVLAELGRKKEAITVATTSMEMAKANAEGDYGYVKNNEALIAKLMGK